MYSGIMIVPVKYSAFRILLFVLPLIISVLKVEAVGTNGAGRLYRGKYVGRLVGKQHKVSGEVYAVDARTIHIRKFSYDGAGPDAFFWTGFTEHPSPQGIIVPNEKGTKAVLGAYNNQDITLTLPEGLSLKDIKWFAVWCRAYEVNFGDLHISPELDFPQPHVIGSLSGQQHGVSSGPIVVVDAQTLLVPDFTYDGQAPDAHFWAGKGKPGPEGIRVSDETGADTPLVRSDRKTMVLTLPGDLTIFDIDYFSVWCRAYYVDFGFVRVPQNINVPPSLKMLGVTPQTKLNCEVLYDRLSLEVRWAIAGESIVIQLVGKIEDGQYISFGLSGDESRSVMIGGDVVVAWFDKNSGRGHVVDYYINSKSQCTNNGVCPDSRLKAEANNVRLLSGSVVNDFTMLTFQRPLRAHDDFDRTITTNASQSVIWAVGPINQRNEASYHSLRNRDDIFIDFGRVPKWNCPAPEADYESSSSTTETSGGGTYQITSEQKPVEQNLQNPNSHLIPNHLYQEQKNQISSAWKVPPILCHEPEDRVFYAQMGPTGGKRGYSAITGKVGWGIAWYINGLLVPEVYLVRGKTYTFVLEGGDKPETPAKYHPFYITDDPEGGYLHKSPADKRKVRIFAGHGGTGTGRLCEWQENGNQPADAFGSYGAYQRSLSLQCDDGHPGILHWTPDAATPDTVYYQCYTHRYLGWKIHIVDSCGGDPSSAALFLPAEQLLSRTGEQVNTPKGENILVLRESQLDGKNTSESNTGPISDAVNNFNTGENPGSTVIDKTVPQSRQELHLPNTGPHLIPRQEQINIPTPQGILYTQNGYIQVPQQRHQVSNFPNLSPTFASQQSYLSPSAAPLLENHFNRKEGQTFQTIDNYGRSDFYTGSTRTPIIAYPLRYDSTHLQRPVAMGSETFRYIIPPGTDGIRAKSSAWPQSRHLPKRDEELFETEESNENLGITLSRKTKDSVEIIKINDTDRQQFGIRGTATKENGQKLSVIGGQSRSSQETQQQEKRSSASQQLFRTEPKLSNEVREDAIFSHGLTVGQIANELSQDPLRLVYQQKQQPQGEQLKKNDIHPQRFIQTENLTRTENSNSENDGGMQPNNYSTITLEHKKQIPVFKVQESQVIPKELSMSYVKDNRDETGFRQDIPRILHYLEKKDTTKVGQSQRERGETIENPKEKEQVGNNQRNRNNTELHILTDIWSIINNKGDMQRPINHKVHQLSESSNWKAPGIKDTLHNIGSNPHSEFRNNVTKV